MIEGSYNVNENPTNNNWQRKALPVLISIISSGGILSGQITATPQPVVAGPNFINVTLVPSPVRAFLQAFGNRLQGPGMERTVLTGTFTDVSGSTTAQITWQVPGQIRFDRANQPTKALIYNPSTGLVNPTISQSDAKILESLLDDSPQTFLYGFKRGIAHQYLGGQFRADDGTTPNFKGPWYAIYIATGPVASQANSPTRSKYFQFDTTTGLLAKVQYASSDSINVETDYEKWIATGGQAFPGQIVRKENGAVVFTFTTTAANAGAAVNDKVFSAQ